MTDLILLKLKMLWLYKYPSREWINKVWNQDPDEQMCCNGHHCACHGSTYYEMWEYLWRHRS